MTEKLIIEIVSVPDREKLVAEIWSGKKMVAEINQEKGQLEIEMYVKKDKPLRLDYDAFVTALAEVKSRLSK